MKLWGGTDSFYAQRCASPVVSVCNWAPICVLFMAGHVHVHVKQPVIKAAI